MSSLEERRGRCTKREEAEGEEREEQRREMSRGARAKRGGAEHNEARARAIEKSLVQKRVNKRRNKRSTPTYIGRESEAYERGEMLGRTISYNRVLDQIY